MNKWDRVEKKPKRIKYTKQDELFDYLKMGLIILVGYLFFHFIIMGWTL
jgi:hypothetical protein|tara:strand:+ start:427 stop:573 length:147 start_codon:yes stop_codon:yes gene_type:complete